MGSTISKKGGLSKTIRNQKKPNSKQLRAISLLQKKVENGENINLWEILVDSGYSPNTAKTPQKVFWKPIVKREIELRGLDPESLKKTHEDLLNARSIEVVSYLSIIPEEEIISTREEYLSWVHISTNEDVCRWIKYYHFIVPDRKIQFKALELAYKLYPPRRLLNEDRVEKIHKKRLEKLKTLSGKLKVKDTNS